MARHRNAYSGEKLTARVELQMTPSDRAAIEAAAAEEGLSLTEFARRLLLAGMHAHNIGRPIRAAKRAVLRGIVERLNEAGKEHNALAKLANEEQRIRDENAVATVCQQLGDLFDKVPPYEKSRSPNPLLKALLNATSAIGNNTMQLRSIAHVNGQDDSVEVLNELEGQMVGALGRALPPFG